MSAFIPAISLRQPWAWLVLHGGKGIENRVWNTKFRGQFLIHAAKGMTRDEYEDALSFVRSIVGDYELARRMPDPLDLPRGGIAGKARLVDVVPPCAPPDFGGEGCACSGAPWHFGKQFGFVLADVEPLPFRPLRGALGFFKVPIEQVSGGAELRKE